MIPAFLNDSGSNTINLTEAIPPMEPNTPARPLNDHDVAESRAARIEPRFRVAFRDPRDGHARLTMPMPLEAVLRFEAPVLPNHGPDAHVSPLTLHAALLAILNRRAQT